ERNIESQMDVYKRYNVCRRKITKTIRRLTGDKSMRKRSITFRSNNVCTGVRSKHRPSLLLFILLGNNVCTCVRSKATKEFTCLKIPCNNVYTGVRSKGKLNTIPYNR